MPNTLLHGIRVLDLTTFLAAPQCGRILSALGADVVKVEAPDKDFFRIEAPLFEVGIPFSDDENPIFLNANAGKRFISVNLRSPEGKEILRRLIERSDILITNMRLPALAKLGIDYEHARQWNPRLVYGHLDGYGLKGAEASKPGFDSQAYLARGGYLLDLTEKGCTPNEMVLGCGDSATGIALLGAVLAGLVRAQKTGEGGFVDVSLLNTAIWNGLMHFTLVQYGLEQPATRKEPIAFAMTNVYRCKDGEWVALNTSQDLLSNWRTLCTSLGAPEAAEDERFRTLENQRKYRAEAVALLDELFSRKTYAEWDEILRDTDVVYERAAHLLDVTEDPQAEANGFFIQRNYPSGRNIKFAAVPIQARGVQEDLTKTIHFGEHTRQILTELGFAPEEIDKLYQDRTVL